MRTQMRSPVMNARRSAVNRRLEEPPRREALSRITRSTALANATAAFDLDPVYAMANNKLPLHAAPVINRSPLGSGIRTIGAHGA